MIAGFVRCSRFYIIGGIFFRDNHNWADEKLHSLQKCNPTYLNLLVGYDNELNQKMLSEQSNTVNDGRRSKPSVWECSEVFFRDGEKCRQADIRTQKPRSTLKWRQSAPDGRRLGNSIEE
ncbi:MAG: hypothetical protein IJZ01_06600 [Paraprevotella sp.]|nr:hypothetical protein [Paraprevotella sp.]